MTVRLRPHHLLCMLTYVGKGYTPAFTAHYDTVAARLTQGEDILVIDGPDDICAPLLAAPDHHCRRDSIVRRDSSAARDVGLLLGHAVEPGTRIALAGGRLRQMRIAFAAGATREACVGCEWADLCSTVAKEGFAGARLTPPGPDRLISP